MLEKQYFIPEPEEFISEKPMTAAMKQIKKERDQEVRDAIAGRSDKMLVIVGPCSAHEPAPTLEYISRLGKLNEKVYINEQIVACRYGNVYLITLVVPEEHYENVSTVIESIKQNFRFSEE